MLNTYIKYIKIMIKYIKIMICSILKRLGNIMITERSSSATDTYSTCQYISIYHYAS